MTSSSPPLILVVSGDEVVRQHLVHDIAHRFGADYTVMAAAATTDAALDRLGYQASSDATATTITSGGNRNPAKADRGSRTGRGRADTFIR